MKEIRPSSHDAILEAGFSVFSKQPGASLSDVAALAGVGRATLHRHFSSREVLLVALAHKAMAELDEAVEIATADAPSYTEGLRLSMVAIVPLANRHLFLTHEAVETDPSVAEKFRNSNDELKEAIECARSEGAFDAAVPVSWIAESYNNLIYAAWTMVRDEEATPKQAAELAWRTLTCGLKG